LRKAQELAFEIDDACLDAARAEIDRKQTVGRVQLRVTSSATR
jgi:hypothetical protein